MEDSLPNLGRFALGGVKYFLFTQKCRLTCAPFLMATLKNDLKSGCFSTQTIPKHKYPDDELHMIVIDCIFIDPDVSERW